MVTMFLELNRGPHWYRIKCTRLQPGEAENYWRITDLS